MVKNLGILDRLLRLILGIFIITYGIMVDSMVAVIGCLVLFTAVIGHCPVYKILKMSSLKKKAESSKENHQKNNSLK